MNPQQTSPEHPAAGVDPVPVDQARVLAAIAACEDGARPTTLEQALGAEPGALRELTDALEASGDVVFLAGRLAVQSEEARARALADLGHAELSALHAALAAAVGRSSYEPGLAEFERARHEAGAGLADAAAARLERVARSAMRAADPELAVRALDLRVAVAVEVAPAMRELRVHAAVEAGDPRAGDQWREALDAFLAAEDPAGAARTTVGWFWSNSGDPAARAALAALAAGRGRAPSGWSHYAAGVEAIMRGAWPDAVAPLEEALASARDLEDAALEVAVLGSLGTARSYLGQLGVAADLLRRCVPLAWAEGDAVAARRVRHNLVEVLIEAQRTGEAVDEAARAAGDAEHRGAPAWAPGAIALHARTLAIAGRIAEARSEAERALLLDRALEPHQRDVYVEMVAADLLAMEGHTPRFRAFVDATEERARAFGFDSYVEALAEVRMRAAAFSGDVAATLAAAPRAGAELEPVTAATLALVAARLLAERPTSADLRATCERLAAAAGTAGRTIPLAELCVREVTAVLDGAADQLDDVAAMWEDAERPVDALLARRSGLLLAGAAAAGDIDAARVAAGLEAAGLGVLHRRGLEQPATDTASASPLEGGAPARIDLGQVPLLTSIPAAERAIVLGALHEHAVEPGDSAPLPRGVCIVQSGEVRLQRVEPETTERRLVVAALGPGDVFGHESLLPTREGATERLRIEAATRSVIQVLPAAVLAQVMADAPRFAAALLADATGRLAEARLLAGESALLPVETRLARTLIRLGERFGRASLRGDLLLDTSLTHADIANMIGSQRARVSGLMSALQKQGVLATWKRRIVVLDLAALTERSGLASDAG